jgi:5-methyltetrahydrofolate--homocysteine methyltransferase
MSRFLEILHSGRVLLMDGAMGTELQRAGLKEGECPELWNLTQPQKVQAIHQAYVDAGAEVLLTNTFQANPWALAKKGLEARSEEILKTGLSLAQSVAGTDRFVFLDFGPTEGTNSPEKVVDLKCLDLLIPQLCSADAIVLETFSDSSVFLAVQTCRLASEDEIPLLLSLSYQRLPSGEPCTRDRHTPEWFASQVGQYKIAALGVNCGRDIGMDEVIEIIRRYRQYTDLPLFVRPNAGTPTRMGDRWVYPHTPEKMGARLPELLEAGVAMVGGCCGTTPEHIAAFRPIVEGWNANRSSQPV